MLTCMEPLACAIPAWAILLLTCRVRVVLSDPSPDLVVENRRLGDLQKITDDFCKLTAADRSELSAVVKTAVKLTPKQEKALQKALTAHPSVGGGNAVTMSNVVDSSIVGGLVVEVEDGGVTRVIDLSAKKKLSELKQLLSG
jgi:ATP synthase F1 delta subunit